MLGQMLHEFIVMHAEVLSFNINWMNIDLLMFDFENVHEIIFFVEICHDIIYLYRVV